MLTLPAETATLKTHAVVATVTRELADPLSASSAKVTVVLVEATLHHLIFVRLQRVEFLQEVVASVY